MRPVYALRQGAWEEWKAARLGIHHPGLHIDSARGRLKVDILLLHTRKHAGMSACAGLKCIVLIAPRHVLTVTSIGMVQELVDAAITSWSHCGGMGHGGSGMSSPFHHSLSWSRRHGLEATQDDSR